MQKELKALTNVYEQASRLRSDPDAPLDFATFTPELWAAWRIIIQLAERYLNDATRQTIKAILMIAEDLARGPSAYNSTLDLQALRKRFAAPTQGWRATPMEIELVFTQNGTVVDYLEQICIANADQLGRQVGLGLRAAESSPQHWQPLLAAVIMRSNLWLSRNAYSWIRTRLELLLSDEMQMALRRYGTKNSDSGIKAYFLPEAAIRELLR